MPHRGWCSATMVRMNDNTQFPIRKAAAPNATAQPQARNATNPPTPPPPSLCCNSEGHSPLLPSCGAPSSVAILPGARPSLSF